MSISAYDRWATQGPSDELDYIEHEARVQGEADCKATGACQFCGGEGRTANPWCTGDQAGGWADTCDECGGAGRVYAEYADLYQEKPAEETRVLSAECANCCHVGPCVDDGEAYICIDQQACRVRAQQPALCPLCPEWELIAHHALTTVEAHAATIADLRLQLATAHEAIGAARALLTEIDGSGNYPHQSVAIGAMLMVLRKATQ